MSQTDANTTLTSTSIEIMPSALSLNDTSHSDNGADEGKLNCAASIALTHPLEEAVKIKAKRRRRRLPAW